MKNNTGLKLPGYEFVQGGSLDGINIGCLSSTTWANKLVSEKDRFKLPILHTRGFFNSLFGHPLDEDLGTDTYIEPTRYFGKHKTLIRGPKTILLGSNASCYDTLKASTSDLAILSENNIFMGILPHMNHVTISNTYNGFLVNGVPWANITADSPYGGGVTGPMPVINPTTFIGGELLIIFAPFTEYIGFSDTGDAYDSSAWESNLITHDIAQLVSVLPSFKKLAIRVYGNGTNGTTGNGSQSFYANQVVLAAMEEGVDIQFTPTVNPLNTPVALSDMVNDYKTFFGL